MSQGIFLDPKALPANTAFPGTVDGLLRLIAQFMEVKGLNNIRGVQVQEAKPSNTGLPWLATDSTGKPLGLFLFHNSIWTSVEHEKGDFKHQDLTGLIHPHWALADNSINPGPINGVTIPTVTDRGLKAATPGGNIDAGEKGGTDELNLAHTHDVGVAISNTKLNANQLGTLNMTVTWIGDSTSGGDSKLKSIDINGNSFTNPVHGGATQNAVIKLNSATSSHNHTATVSQTSKLSATQDIRSLYYGARLLIYIGVE